MIPWVPYWTITPQFERIDYYKNDYETISEKLENERKREEKLIVENQEEKDGKNIV